MPDAGWASKARAPPRDTSSARAIEETRPGAPWTVRWRVRGEHLVCLGMLISTVTHTTDEFDGVAVLDALGVGVIIQDVDARIIYANQAALDGLGLTLDEIVGVTSFDPRWSVIRPDGRDYPGHEHPVPIAIETKRPVRGAIMGVYRPRTEDRVWLQVTALPELDEHGEVQRIVCSFEDVSAAQEARQASESLYQSVIRAMSEGVVVHEPDSSIRMANPAAERILGLPVEQMSGRTPIDPRWRLRLPDDSPLHPEQIPSEVTRKTGHPVKDFLLRVHRPTGEQAWLSVSTDPFDEGDAGYGVVATFTDVTAEREAALEVQRSRAQLERVLDAVPGAVYQYVLEDNGTERFEFASARSLEVMGIDPDEVTRDADAFWCRVHPEDTGPLRESILRSAQAFAPWEFEFRVGDRDAGYRWINARSIPERSAGAIRWTGVAIDMTETRRMREHMQQHQQREALGDMAAGIAHNFNNMLAAISPNLEMARSEAQESIQPFLDDAYQAAISASDLVAQLLSLARSNRVEASHATVNVVPLVEEAVAICRRLFDRAITIESTLGASEAHVVGRASHLQQVLLNLCINARDALAGHPSPRLEVGLRIDPDPDPRVEVWVADNGLGMDEETLRRLGEPFFTTKEPGRGTGLGLATAYRTVQDIGGTISCESQLGAGTKFRLRLPLAPIKD